MRLEKFFLYAKKSRSLIKAREEEKIEDMNKRKRANRTGK